jgi:hypothetical protein
VSTVSTFNAITSIEDARDLARKVSRGTIIVNVEA